MAKEGKGADRSARELGGFFVEYLEKALEAARQGETSRARHYISKILRQGFASIIGKRRDKKGSTTLVHHLVVNRKGRVVHEGIHGARDWEPGKVQFKNRKDEDPGMGAARPPREKTGMEEGTLAF